MIYRNVELHNVVEVRPHNGGVAMQRVPESVRRHLNEGAQAKVLQPGSGEIRFAAEKGRAVRITLSCTQGEAHAVPYFGDFRQRMVLNLTPEPRMFEIPWTERLGEHWDALMQRRAEMAFAPNMLRMVMRGEQVVFHGVEGEGIRPPQPEEVPRLRLLMYGTSITHGAAASYAHLTYAAQTARRLKVDLLNFGLGGSCHCEPQLADCLAGRDDWHLAVLALSVNMLNGFSADGFRERVRYFVHTMANSNPQRPVFAVTLYPHFRDLAFGKGDAESAKAAEFRQILREAVAESPTSNVSLVEGESILPGFRGLTTDLIHPGDDGMIEMGENLARQLQPTVDELLGVNK